MNRWGEYSEGTPEKCDVTYCNSPHPKLYDDRTGLQFCDTRCLEEWLMENIEDVSDWYSKMNIHEN